MRRALGTFGFLVLTATLALADDAPKPATVTAKKAEVAFHVDLAGVVDLKEPVEVAFRPQVWGDEIEVEDARAPGAVAAGDVLVRFKTEKIDDAIRAAERDLAITKAAFAVQTEDDKGAEIAAATGVAVAEKSAKDAAEALATFETVEMPLRLEESDHNLQAIRNWVTDQTEELAQLEKMYKSDDLTEETEDIVLKRARRELDRTKKGLDFQTRRAKVSIEIDTPRDLAGLKLGAKKAGEDRDRVVAVTKLQREQAKLELDRAKANLEKQERDVARLTADRALFELKSPAAGMAVPGAYRRGKWLNSDDVKFALRKGVRFRPNDVLFTVITDTAWRVATSAPEASVVWLRAGQEATIVASQPGVASRPGKVAPLSWSTSGAEFPVDVEPLSSSDAFVGMSCRVRIETGKRAAILIPQTAVEDGGFEKWVHVVGGDGAATRRLVTLGQSHEQSVEVLTGLADGENVLETAPKK